MQSHGHEMQSHGLDAFVSEVRALRCCGAGPHRGNRSPSCCGGYCHDFSHSAAEGAGGDWTPM